MLQKREILRLAVAVPGALLADGAASSLTDRGHSLWSLYLPSGSAPIAPAQDDSKRSFCGCVSNRIEL